MHDVKVKKTALCCEHDMFGYIMKRYNVWDSNGQVRKNHPAGKIICHLSEQRLHK